MLRNLAISIAIIFAVSSQVFAFGLQPQGGSKGTEGQGKKGESSMTAVGTVTVIYTDDNGNRVVKTVQNGERIPPVRDGMKIKLYPGNIVTDSGAKGVHGTVMTIKKTSYGTNVFNYGSKDKFSASYSRLDTRSFEFTEGELAQSPATPN